MAAGGRRWCFTLNNYSEEEYEMFNNLDVNSIVIGKEVGDNNTPHLQGFIKFKVVKRLAGLKKICSRAHWEKAKGSDKQNLIYCTKGGDSIKKGVFSTGEKGGGCATMKLALECCDKPWDSLTLGEKCVYLKHEKAIHRYKQLNQQSEYKAKMYSFYEKATLRD